MKSKDPKHDSVFDCLRSNILMNNLDELTINSKLKEKFIYYLVRSYKPCLVCPKSRDQNQFYNPL